MMAKDTITQTTSTQLTDEEHGQDKHRLGPLLCWAVVFADIGTSVYYVPGILYANVGKLAGFFVFLTMSVFVLLTLKYAEVTQRYPQGGGVVTVAALAINKWVGALGGMFILVDYFLTAAISGLSGMLYLSVVAPAIGPYALWITVGILILLGVLNWVGISESAKVSLVGAVIAFGSDVAILVTVFTHISFGDFLALFTQMFQGRAITPVAILTGFAGSFLAFSGLESISQLSPVMKTPRKKVAGMALLIVVLTIGITSPVLTMLSTILQENEAANAAQSTQLISLLAGHWGNTVLQTEVAISASALLVFASNTAIIGTYHVFIALARLEFFPSFVLQRNKLRNTPHYSIGLAAGIPIAILIAVNADIIILGDMYAFGLLGAFTLTCLGLDIVRYKERKLARIIAQHLPERQRGKHHGIGGAQMPAQDVLRRADMVSKEFVLGNGDAANTGVELDAVAALAAASQAGYRSMKGLWYSLNFWLGVLTTVLVLTAWTTNLISKPLATAFGGSVAALGMGVSYVVYKRHQSRGHAPVIPTGIGSYLPGSILAVLTAGNPHNDAVINTAIHTADGHPVIFLFIGKPAPDTYHPPDIFEVVDPYLDDAEAKRYFGRAEHQAQKAKIQRRFVYRHQAPGTVARFWQLLRPHDTIVTAEEAPECVDLNPDRIRYELTPEGKVAHMVKNW
ncbi:MAG TPA: APC family permease [Ktedonobacteraceae bacterium]|nr:APC family permease [Ktedonobacteraceae bacterium]